MESSEKFVLRWDGFTANTGVVFRELRETDEFSDLTLVSGDGKQVRAHQVILAGGSSFVHKILKGNPHPHPLIYLKVEGVKYKQLLSIMDFVYSGEANIIEEDLNDFLVIAEDLKVKGLTRNGALGKTDNKQSKSRPTTPGPQKEIDSLPQGPVATKEHDPAPGVSHQGPIGTKESAPVLGVPHQGPVAAKVCVIAPGVSHQGQVASEECSPTNPRSETSSYNNNIVPLSTGQEHHDGTCNIKVEVGDDDHYNVYNGTNEHGEAYITDVCRRDVDKTEGRGLLIEQEKNGQPLSTKKQTKEEKMYSISNVVITKVADGPDVVPSNEHSIHDWYEQSEENNLIMAQDQNIELETKSSWKSHGYEEDMVDIEVVDSAFVNQGLVHNSGDDNMRPDGQQDLVLPFEEKDFHCS